MLAAAPELRAVAIFEEIQKRHPDLSDGARRTSIAATASRPRAATSTATRART
jgi:hypothetical protein